MIQEEIVKGDLLYHAVHGVCRVDEVSKEKESGKQVLRYSLVPKVANQMKARFIITAVDMEASGFHEPVSLKEANKILNYLKVEHKTVTPPVVTSKAVAPVAWQNRAWGMAQAILTFSHEKFEAQDQRKRQSLERSAKGLVGELAFVFKSTLKETAARVQKSLGNTSKINPLVLVALTHAGED
ncbi:MAG: hypothetical protein A3G33_00200 [Omnitrophica bacterium RIFCSPLOWO2_12_FULL_44_17]|uniref:CarD-like/TRCF RNAP-interacting domain-containing protein n=1 Tax=Candidatus Danuiimicrobium aquiferis TaxID=1801832 RepID=A0A1G1KUG8_9BACT|nr:MAG: hypothetical protein A3B72_00285 [Omnitrophica bacterium RIFCSPHIGHO2_02_FULL_45_28]OGW96219.1 MAG: hypothetical protein A3G33_00200 [Omnitrophica bacterium RIFCSPLOWO2_12_FULL_44_17]OGX02131.1 MAG: hypothetical protein A3J12_01780 [Omnitrophica bacterium RIFCSPLOWO2_02_FULL_44_11]